VCAYCIHLVCKRSVLPYVVLIFSVTALSQCSNSNQLITSCWLACIRITITHKPWLLLLLLLLLLSSSFVNTFTQGITYLQLCTWNKSCRYIVVTVYAACNVTSHEDCLHSYVSTFWSVYAVPNMAVFYSSLNFPFSRFVAEVFSAWFWYGSSCHYYYLCKFIIIIIILIITELALTIMPACFCFAFLPCNYALLLCSCFDIFVCWFSNWPCDAKSASH
jgi:hypothetical protein